MPDELEWRAVERRVLRRGPAVAVRRPRWTCCASSRCRRSAACAWAPPSSRLQRLGRRTRALRGRHRRASGSRARMGRRPGSTVWGPLLRGKFGDRADDIAMVWLWSKFTPAPPARGRGGAQEKLGYPRASWEPLLERAARRIEAGGGRVLIDRPAARLAQRRRRLRRHRRRAGLVPPRPRPARASRPRRARALRPRALHAPQRRLRRRSPATCCRPPTLAAALDRVLRRAVPAARARPPVQPLLLDQRRRPRAAVHRADRAHQLRRARALRRPPLPLRRQLPPARPRAAGSVARRGARALRRRACARSTRPSTATGSRQRGCSASRPPSRSSPSATSTASRRCSTGVPGLVLANTTQVYPEDRGTNYAVRLGDDARA